MASNREIITDALRMLTVIDANQNASIEDATLGLREMNDLMSSLEADGVDLGYPPQDNLQDDFPLDATTAAQVKVLLAARLFTHFPSSVVGESLAGRAMQAERQLKRVAVLSNMEEATLRHVPLGERRGWYWDIASDE